MFFKLKRLEKIPGKVLRNSLCYEETVLWEKIFVKKLEPVFIEKTVQTNTLNDSFGLCHGLIPLATVRSCLILGHEYLSYSGKRTIVFHIFGTLSLSLYRFTRNKV